VNLKQRLLSKLPPPVLNLLAKCGLALTELQEGSDELTAKKAEAARKRQEAVEFDFAQKDDSMYAGSADVNLGDRNLVDVINPLDAFLGPVQRKLGVALRHARVVRRILSWEDPRITLLLLIGLMLTTILAGTVLWLVDVEAAEVVGWALRLAALAATGPHMFLVGLHLEKKTKGKEEAEMEFAASDDTGRAVILKTHREAMLEKAVDKVTKGLVPRLKTRAERDAAAFILNDAHVKTSWSDPLVPGDKYVVQPSSGSARPIGSYAPPAVPSETAAAPSETVPLMDAH